MTIEDELERLRNVTSLHDGEKTFVAETIVYTGFDDSGFSGAFCHLNVKDIEGRTFTISMPNGFIEKLVAESVNHLVNNLPVEKSKKS